MLTPYAETIPRSFRLVMMPGLHIVITAADHDQERRSSAPCGPTRAGSLCGAVSQEWEGGTGDVRELAGAWIRLRRSVRSRTPAPRGHAGGATAVMRDCASSAPWG